MIDIKQAAITTAATLYGVSEKEVLEYYPEGWKEAAIAWEVCASIHRSYCKGKDPLYSTRQADFVKHAKDARAMLAAAPEPKEKP